MKLWKITRASGLVGYDETAGAVIRAATEEDARAIASKNLRGDEKSSCWLRPLASTCVELLPDGEPGIVLVDFRAG